MCSLQLHSLCWNDFIGNCSPSTHVMNTDVPSMRWVQPRISEPWINSKGVLHAVLIGPIGDFLCQMHRQDTCTSHELHLPVVKSYVTRVRFPENHSCFIKTSKAMSLLRPTMTSSFQCNILDGGHWEIDDIFSSPKHSATFARNLNPETPSLPSWQSILHVPPSAFIPSPRCTLLRL